MIQITDEEIEKLAGDMSAKSFESIDLHAESKLFEILKRIKEFPGDIDNEEVKAFRVDYHLQFSWKDIISFVEEAREGRKYPLPLPMIGIEGSEAVEIAQPTAGSVEEKIRLAIEGERTCRGLTDWVRKRAFEQVKSMLPNEIKKCLKETLSKQEDLGENYEHLITVSIEKSLLLKQMEMAINRKKAESPNF